MDSMIEARNLTLRYPSGKGIFELNFSVKEGEVLGYLGPNGAGKTTTIRALLGFMSPSSGSCSISGLDCSQLAPAIQKLLGYIPGEISFLDGMNGDEFLKFMHHMRNTKDSSRQKELTEMFELDPRGRVKKFSKGMKQKLGIIAAFMHDPKVLILDEPTSGLDPIMQSRFVDLILKEKARGKTILMSSHMFEEVERTCDNVLIIKDGHIIKQADVQTLKVSRRKGFILHPADTAKASQLLSDKGFEVVPLDGDSIEVFVSGGNIDRLIKTAAQFTILNFSVKEQTLEDLFIRVYDREGTTL